jgi:hypothetical protein
VPAGHFACFAMTGYGNIGYESRSAVYVLASVQAEKGTHACSLPPQIRRSCGFRAGCVPSRRPLTARGYRRGDSARALVFLGTRLQPLWADL